MRKWLPLVAFCLGMFMLLVDVTIVSVALPDMSHSLKASFTDLQWVMDGYALALASLLLLAGSVADLFGRRRVYAAGLVFFAAASLACGLAPNAAFLIGARLVQGIGGAAMLATGMALLNSTYTGRDRGVAFGAFGAVAALAAAAGPLIGGLLTQHLDWRWIFFVNLPFSVLTLALTLTTVTRTGRSRGVRLDLPGMATFTTAAASVTYALIKAGDVGWTARSTLGFFGLGAVALIAFVLVELRVRRPMLDLGLFRRPSFVAIMIAATLVSASAFAYGVYVSLWLQAGLGYGPVKNGLVLLPMAISAFVVSALTGRFLHDAPPRLTVGGGLLLIGVGAGLLAVLDANSTWVALLPGLIVCGLGVGVCLPPLTGVAMAAVPPERGGMASGAVNTFRQLGLALGIAVLGVTFRTGISDRLTGHVPDPHAAAGALSGGRPVVEPHLARAAYASGLNTTFGVAAALGLAAGVIALLFIRRPAPVTTPEPELART